MVQRILGLDVGHSAVKGVVLELEGREHRVVDYHRVALDVDLTEPEDIEENRTEAVRELVQYFGEIDQVFTNLPGGVGICTVMEFPFSDTGKIDQVLGLQLDDTTPFELEELIYDYQFVQRDKDLGRVMVGSAQRLQVAAYLNTLQEAGADPRYLMMDGLPYYHLFQELLPPAGPTTWGVLDIGYRYTTLSVFQYVEGEDKDPMRTELVRYLSRGTYHLEQAIQQSMELGTQEEASLALHEVDLQYGAPSADPRAVEAVNRAMTQTLTEIRRTVATLQRKQGLVLDRLYITGGGSNIQHIDQYLAQRLTLEVVPLAPEVPLSEEVEGWYDHASQYLKALSLTMRHHHRSRYAQLNLRKGQFSYKGDLEFLRERLGSLMVGAAILFVLFLVSIFTQFYVMSKEHSRLEEQVQKQCRSILGSEVASSQDCLYKMNVAIAQASGNKNNSVIPTYSSYDMFLEVYARIASLLKTQGVKLEISRLRFSEKRFVIEGDTNSYSSVNKIERALKSYRCFAGLKRGFARISSGKTGKKVEFRLTADLKC